MAHKTLVGGTAYDITGGLTLVSGTSYSIENGKVLVNGTEYDISFLLPPAILDLWSGGSESTISCVAYENGYWVVGGRYYDGSNYHARIAYSTSLDGTWTTKDLWAGTSGYHNIYCITYANGYWVVGGSYWDGSSTNSARIAYAASPNGTWTTKDLWGEQYIPGNYIYCITYANGYWAVCGRRAKTASTCAQIAYATALAGTWTQVTAWTGTYSQLRSITYANGYWVTGGWYYDGGSYHYAQISYSTSITGTWTTKTLWRAADSTINSVAYANGYWMVGGSYYDGSTFSARIAYTTSPGGTWTTKDLWGGSNYPTINCVAYLNGNWVAGGFYWDGSNYIARIADATAPDGTWTTKDLWSGNGSNNTVNCITYANGYWVVGGKCYDGTNYARIAYAGSVEGFDEI